MKECNSDENIEIFAVCGQETSKQTQKIANAPKAIEQFLKMFPDKNTVCVVMETGTHSLWISRLVKKLCFEAIVAHARDLKLIYASDKKNDSFAGKLAALMPALWKNQEIPDDPRFKQKRKERRKAAIMMNSKLSHDSQNHQAKRIPEFNYV